MALNSNRHMDDDEIESYSMGAVSEEESAQFDGHLLICESCRKKVKKSDDYVAAMRGAALRARGYPRGPGITPRSFPRLLPFLSAAALLAMAAIVGSHFWVRGTMPAFAVNLEATRGPGIDARAPAGRPLVLNLDLSGLSALPSYRVETVDRLGKVVWQGSVAPQDSKAAASLPGVSPGVYFVRVYTPSGELLREYGLDVQH
jgi:hypothetical protein